MLVDILRNSKKPIYVKIILIWLSCFTNYASKQPIYFLNRMMLRNTPTALSMWWVRSLLNQQKGIKMSV